MWGWAVSREPGAQGGSELAPGLSSVGGSQNLRFYWKEFVNEVDVLVFMVDSADRLRLPWARQELHKLLDKDPDLPVVVVANKQVRAIEGWRAGRSILGWGGILLSKLQPRSLLGSRGNGWGQESGEEEVKGFPSGMVGTGGKMQGRGRIQRIRESGLGVSAWSVDQCALSHQVCTDINECETGQHNCVPNSVCVNTVVRPGRTRKD